jgi:hypothetical protein
VWCGVISQCCVPEARLEPRGASKQAHGTTYCPDLCVFENVQLLVLVYILSR